MRFGPTAWFRDLPIGSKLLVSFVILLLLIGLSLTAILFYLARINSYVDRHHRITVPALVAAAGMRQQAVQAGLLLAELSQSRTSAEREAAARQVLSKVEAIRHALHRYRTEYAARTHPVLFRMLTRHGRAHLADQEDAALAKAERLVARWQPDELVSPNSTPSGNGPSIRTRIEAGQAVIQQLADVFTGLIELNTLIATEMKTEGDALQAQGRWVILGLIVLVGVVTASIFVMTRSQIAFPLRQLAHTADRVAHGNLAADFEPWPTRDEVGRLTESLRTMLGTLRAQTSSLERKTRELESFTYTVAHDLKTPLREIEGFSALLEQRYGPGLDATARHYLDMIRSSTLRLVALIDDLLRYSRLEQQELTCSTIDLRTLLAEVIAEQVRNEAVAPSVRVDLPFRDLWGEPASLRQVFVNLIANAVKFSRHVPRPEISIGGRIVDGEQVVWIADNGIGFDPSEATRIFGLFERLHPPEEYEGTGVGLAIVKLVMEKHGGRVWAESAPGKGSTFYLAFPLGPDAASRNMGDHVAA